MSSGEENLIIQTKLEKHSNKEYNEETSNVKVGKDTGNLLEGLFDFGKIHTHIQCQKKASLKFCKYIHALPNFFLTDNYTNFFYRHIHTICLFNIRLKINFYYYSYMNHVEIIAKIVNQIKAQTCS